MQLFGDADDRSVVMAITERDGLDGFPGIAILPNGGFDSVSTPGRVEKSLHPNDAL